MIRPKIIGLIALTTLAGCSTDTVSYWTRKGDAIVVHHVTGTKDATETLTTKALASDDVEFLGLKKGHFYQVADSSSSPSPARSKKIAKPDDKPKKDTKDSRTARLADDVRDLRSQVARLSSEIQASPAPSPSPVPDQGMVGNNQTAQPAPQDPYQEIPRMSQ
jgi:hypothetical protein